MEISCSKMWERNDSSVCEQEGYSRTQGKVGWGAIFLEILLGKVTRRSKGVKEVQVHEKGKWKNVHPN